MTHCVLSFGTVLSKRFRLDLVPVALLSFGTVLQLEIVALTLMLKLRIFQLDVVPVALPS